MRFEQLESRNLLTAATDSLLVQVDGPVENLPSGWVLEPAGQSGYTKLIHGGDNELSIQMAMAKKIKGLSYIGLNHLVQTNKTPNDPRFDELWGMKAIEAETAWDTVTDSSVVVASIDTGVNMTHPDLQSNIYRNPGEIPNNGIDDDENGFVDDVNGWDFVNEDNDPTDQNLHGSHTSGSIGAQGNNAIGVVGINWNIQIMPVQFLDEQGRGTIADAIQAIDYVAMMGVPISNNSWGTESQSDNPSLLPLKEAIELAGQNNHLFVASAGNSNTNNDTSLIKNLPASWDSPNILSVAASTPSDDKASFSSYGKTTVDLAAPGVSILSTCLGTSYCTASGTSMSAPHAASAAALVATVNPDFSFQQIKETLINTVDPLPQWENLVASGGRLNLAKAIGSPPPAENLPPNAVDDFYSTEANKTLVVNPPGVMENDSDPDGDALTVSLQTSPEHGSISLNSNGGFTYKPEMGFSGQDVFTYALSDGELTDSANVFVEVGLNKPPNAVDDFYRVNSGNKLVINPPGVIRNDSDPDGDNLTVSLEKSPANGSVVLDTDGSFVYEPTAGFSGKDSFDYILSDGELTDTATAVIEVQKVNLPPVAVDDFYEMVVNETLSVDPPGVLENDTDPNNDSLTAHLSSSPRNGVLTLRPNGGFSYAPSIDFIGTDSWTYLAFDGRFIDKATVTIKIKSNDPVPPPENNPPIGNPDFYIGPVLLHGYHRSLLQNDIDPDGDPISVTLESQPKNGTLLLFNPNGTFIYIADAGFRGIDQFTYDITDDKGAESEEIVVMLAVTGLLEQNLLGGI